MNEPKPYLKVRQGARLPHGTRQGATYAVTFRLADSLPKSVLESWTFERQDIIRTAKQMGRPLTSHEKLRLEKVFAEKVEKYLDEGLGASLMRDSRIASIVANALTFFDGTRYDLLAWCVMPNHVHVALRPLGGHDLPGILHSWKSHTAKEINKLLGSRGQVWETEYYDHMIRDERDLQAQVDYVLANPRRAGLEDWKWVGVARASRP
jgi:REP element-mobilizing transposase RayT